MPVALIANPVPYACQYASPDLVRAFVHGELPLEHDPRWAEYGAASSQEYAHWAPRACGVVAVKMVAEGLGGAAPRPVMDWVRAGLALDGYLAEVRPDRPDRRVEKGWKHAALAQLLRDQGLEATLTAGLDLAGVAGHIRAGRVLIASVSSELGEEGPITRRSGHLVVVWGVLLDEQGRVEAVILHNPSGRTPELQVGARIPAARFVEAFCGRGIVVQRGPQLP